MLALRAYAAERIQARWRGCGPRRRFAPKIVALRKLVKRERAIREARRRSAFGGWKVEHRARMELMRGTRRAFYRWKIESERLAEVSALFRGTFWPLYVWRRWTNYRVSSSDKVCQWWYAGKLLYIAIHGRRICCFTRRPPSSSVPAL